MNLQITKLDETKILTINELNDFFARLPKLSKKDRSDFLMDIRKIRHEINFIKNTEKK